MQSDPHDFDDDNIPWASPEIQLNYEAALGRFMLAFNRLDNSLTGVLKMALSEAGRSDLIKACTGRGDFWLKLLAVDLLKCSTHGACLSNVPIDLMRTIAAHRNKVAHGHFDQNPYGGEYDIIVKNVRVAYSVEDLDAQTQKANDAWTILRHSEACYQFPPLPPE